jgi:predicted metal-binding protein
MLLGLGYHFEAKHREYKTVSLIACTECGYQVSDKAASCPQCGAPVSSRAAEPVVTTQLTAKKFKLQELLAVAAIIAGVVIVIVADGQAGRLIGGALALAGFVLYISARIRAWWNSG